MNDKDRPFFDALFLLRSIHPGHYQVLVQRLRRSRGAVRLATSTGLAVASTDATIIATAIGDDVLPRVPARNAKAPKFGTSIPYSAACGAAAS